MAPFEGRAILFVELRDEKLASVESFYGAGNASAVAESIAAYGHG